MSGRKRAAPSKDPEQPTLAHLFAFRKPAEAEEDEDDVHLVDSDEGVAPVAPDGADDAASEPARKSRKRVPKEKEE